KELAKYNGQLAITFAQSKVREIKRNIQTGKETAGGTTRLNNAFEDLKDAWRPFQSALTNLPNTILTPLVKILTGILNFLKPIFSTLGDILDRLLHPLEGADARAARRAKDKADDEAKARMNAFPSMNLFQQGAAGKIQYPKQRRLMP